MSRIALLALALSACTTHPADDGGQSGEEDARCDAVRTVDLGDDEPSELGFGLPDVLALVDGAHAGTLAWDEGGSTPLTVTVSAVAAPRFLDREVVDDPGDGGQEPAFEEFCPDVVAVDATVAFATDDGAFDEVWDVQIDAAAADQATFWVELDLDALGGTYTFADAGSYDAVRAFVDGRFDATGSHGAVNGQGESVDGDVASATNLPIATW